MYQPTVYQHQLDSQYEREEAYSLVDSSFNMNEEIKALQPKLTESFKIKNYSLWEVPIYEAYKALLLGTMSNYQTSIMMFTKFLQKVMPNSKLNQYEMMSRAEKMLSLISENSFVFQIRGDSEYQRVTIKTIKEIKELIQIKPISFPMVIPPKPILNNKNAGYWYMDRSVLIGRSKKHNRKLALDVLDIQGAIPMALNHRALERLHSTPIRDTLNPTDKNGYQKEAHLLFQEELNAKIFRDRMKEFQTKVKDNPVYCPCGYDSRGRLYPLDNTFNYQTDKSLLQLYNKKKLNQMGINYLLMDLASHYGSCSPKLNSEIHFWYQENKAKTFFGINLSKLSITPNEPFKGDKSTWSMRLLQGVYHLLKGAPKSEISDYREYHNSRDALIDHFKYGKPTGALIGLDATCSAAQIISLSMGDETGMLNSNVIAKPDEDKRYDVYQAISDATNNIIDREKMKYVVMPEFYNSQAKAKEVFPDKEEREVYFEARDRTIPSGQDCLRRINALWDNNESYFSWTLPDGHFATIRAYENSKYDLKCDDLEATLFIKCREYGPSEYYIPLAANIIQSIDAYINRLMIRKAHAKGISIITVHDNFLTHPNDVHQLRAIFTECLYQVNEEQVLQDIFKQLGGWLPNYSKRVKTLLDKYPNKYAIC